MGARRPRSCFDRGMHGPMALPPGPTAPPFVQLARIISDPIGFFDACAARHGDAFTVRITGQPPLVMFSHPDAIREIFTSGPDDFHAGEGNAPVEVVLGKHSLLLLDGAAHLRQRKLLMPPFHGPRLHVYAGMTCALTDDALASWPRGRPFPVLRETRRLALEIILRTVFGIDDAARLEQLRERLYALVNGAQNPMVPAFALALSPARIAALFRLAEAPAPGAPGWRSAWRRALAPLLPWSGLAAALREVDVFLYAEIARRREAGTAGRTDVLSMLIDARDEAGAPMTPEELRDEMVTLLIAGYETTATTLAWTLKWLVEHPAALAKARAELAAVAGDGAPDPSALASLSYLDAVIRETLRLNSALPNLLRRVQKPVRIGGIDLPVGVMVGPVMQLTHMRRDVWGDPEAFRPERFLERKVTPYEFYPFGGGTRRCIGMAFAMFEIKVALTRILPRFDLRAGSDRPVRPVRHGVALAPSGGMPLVVLDREPATR